MKRPTIFLHNLTVPFHFYMLTKFCDQHLFKKKMAPVSIYPQNLAYFSNFEHNFRPIHENRSIFVTYSSCLFQFLHSDVILLRSHFYNKNDRGFNLSNKLLLISKSVFMTPCFKIFLVYTIYLPNICNFR